MRVLLVTHYTLPHIGGIEVLAEETARRLVADGDEVCIVSSRAGGAARESRDGVRFVRVAAWNGLESALHVPYPVFAPSLVAVLAREVRRADVVHAHGLLYLGSWCALLMARLFRRPFVVTEHVGFVPYRSRVLNAVQRLALTLTARVFLRQADAVFALSASVLEWLTRLTPHPERLHFVGNAVDVERFRVPDSDERKAARAALAVPPGRPVALFVGRFVPKKGLEQVLALAGPAVQVVLCGRGELQANVPPGVLVLREVPRARMPEVYATADVLVLPSRGEGFPTAAMEAMACGVPVVAARDPGYDRYGVGDGMVQTDADGPSFRSAVLELLSDPAEHGRRAGEARRAAVSRFALATLVERHRALYAHVRGAHALDHLLEPLSKDLATALKLPVLRELLRGERPGPRIDIGPGSGHCTHQVFGPGPVIVQDISLANLRSLQARARRAGCADRFLPVVGDLNRLPFRDGSLATVLCAEVLEHLVDDQPAARELARVLATAGRLVVEVPDASRGYANHLERFGIASIHDQPGPEHHYRRGYSAHGLDGLLAAHGLARVAGRPFVGRASQLLIDGVALLHLTYQRVRYGRRAWHWSDVHQLTDTFAFRVYRMVFPLLRGLCRLDRLPPGRPGFALAAGYEHRSPGRPSG